MKEREAETDRQALRPTTYSPGHHESAAEIGNSCHRARQSRRPGRQHSQVYVLSGECCSRSVLPVGPHGSARQPGSEPCSLPGESGFPTKLSGSTGVANYKEKNKHARSMAFVSFASSFLFY